MNDDFLNLAAKDVLDMSEIITLFFLLIYFC
jgi:hypothetical protein